MPQRSDAVDVRGVALAGVLLRERGQREEDGANRRRLVARALGEERIGLLLRHRPVMLRDADVKRRKGERTRSLRRHELLCHDDGSFLFTMGLTATRRQGNPEIP